MRKIHTRMACGLSGMQFLHLFSGRGRACNPRVSRACRRTLSKAARISPTLLDAEKHGATFYDQNNQRKDPIAILKENGVNYVRLRLWVDPQSASGEDYGGGNNDLATTLAAGETGVKAQGMKLLFRFLTTAISGPIPASSSSRKPGKAGLPAELKTAIHDYTRDTIARFKQAGVLPDTWCRSATKSTAASCGRKEKLGAGRRRVRPAGWPAERGYRAGLKENLRQGEQVKIMLHLAEGDQERYLPLVV